MAQLAMEKTGYTPEQTAMIGDRLYTDIASGVNAGVNSIFVLSGEGTLEDLDKLEILAKNIKESSLCGLGQSAPNPVLSKMKYFRDEYIAHVVDKKCPAGVCKSMVQYLIFEEVCKRCGICKKNCPTGAISGDKETPFVIDQDKCVKCGICMEKCPFKAILKNA
jgi:NADP-reducing hydrogenase subunit HndC